MEDTITFTKQQLKDFCFAIDSMVTMAGVDRFNDESGEQTKEKVEMAVEVVFETMKKTLDRINKEK